MLGGGGAAVVVSGAEAPVFASGAAAIAHCTVDHRRAVPSAQRWAAATGQAVERQPR
jgi:hypothetical protein